MMCLECLEHYHAQLQTPASTCRPLREPPWETMSDVEVLDVLPQILRSAEQVNEFAAEWVGLLRERKISWSAIGNVLGVSRQAAWERFDGRGSARRRARPAREPSAEPAEPTGRALSTLAAPVTGPDHRVVVHRSVICPG